MSEENEQVFRRVIEEGYNKGNLAALDALFAINFVEHQDGFVPPNVQGVKGNIVSLRAAFPNLKLTVEAMIASGDQTCTYYSSRHTARVVHGAATYRQVFCHHRN